MNTLVAELKTRARLRLNAARRADPQLAAGRAGPRLRHCLTLVSAEAGFTGWEQARRVLTGRAEPGDDMGAFWHAPRCTGLLSHWFSGYPAARAFLAGTGTAVLLPYRRQFVVADRHYLHAIGVPPDAAAWRDAGRDLVAVYGTPHWLDLAQHRLRATRADRAPADGSHPAGTPVTWS